MADIVNKQTKSVLRSINTPLWDKGLWWINPSLLDKVPTKYWKDDGSNQPEEMTNEEKIIVDGVIANIETTKQWKAIRARRNSLLVNTDWTQLGDVPLDSNTVSNWEVYRQQLRDVPQTYATPEDARWPDFNNDKINK